MISLMFRSFGKQAPELPAGARRFGLAVLAFLFVTASVLILAVINFFSLFFGVTVNFLGRDGVKFTFLQLFRRIPLVGFTLPILAGYAAWHNAKLFGGLATAMPSIVTALAAVAMLGGTVLCNSIFSSRGRKG